MNLQEAAAIVQRHEREAAPKATFTRTSDGWQVRVFGSSEVLTGQKVEVARRSGMTAVRLGRLVADSGERGQYYEFQRKGA